MIARLVIALAAGLVGAGIVHIVGVLSVPAIAGGGAVERVAALGAPGAFRPVPTNDPFARAVACLVPGDGPRRVIATGGGALGFWSATVFAPGGEAVYSLNDRTAIDEAFDLILAAPDDVARLRGELDETAPELVAVPAPRGRIAEGAGAPVAALVVLRTHVTDPTLGAEADAFLASATCEPLEVG